MEDDEQDVYVAQLHEVFDSCDRVGKGFLDRNELIELCKKLQLDDQIPQLLQQLLGSEEANGQVTFEDFKEGFVAVLSLAIDNLSSSEDEAENTLESSEPPKLVKNEKRYGRKSKPENSYSEDLYSGDDESVVSSRPESRANTTIMTNGISDISHDEETHNKERERGKVRRRLSSRKSSLRNSIRRHNSVRWQKKPSIEKSISQEEIEVLEASGEMRSTQSPVSVNSGYASPEPSEEEQLRAIWSEVHVGANGYLDRHELALVCEHIGMDSMNDQEIALLFEELDEDSDGKVSFDEFLNGLFAAKDHYNSQEIIEEELTEVQHSTPYSKPPGLASASRLKNSSRVDDLFLSRTGASSSFDLLTILDPENTGFAKVEDITDLWSAQGLDDAVEILKHIDVDADGRVNLNQLTNLLETVIHEQSDGLSNAVVGIYKHEVVFLRSHLDQMTNERDALKDNIGKISEEKEMLIKESEDATRQLERLHEGRLRETESSFLDKMQNLQQTMSEERNKDLMNASHHRSMLEDSLKMTKGEESRLRQKLADAEEEILRLEKTLAESQDKLNEADVTRERLEKELDSMSDLSGRLADLEKQQLLKQQQNRNANKGVRELERINRELRDENDELRLQVEGLVNQVNTSVKRRPSHRKRQSGEKGVNRKGSVLSDYTKPTVIRRKKDGGSSGEESEEEEDQVDGENEAEKQSNLETIKKLEAEIKDKDSSISELQINAQNERDALESKLKQLSDEISAHENSIKEKDINIQNLKNEVATLRSMHDSKEDDAHKRYETELANLTSQFTGEMEQLQMSLVQEKEQLEHEYQEKMKEMEKSFSSEKNRLSDELEGNFAQMKEMLISEYENEKSEMEEEHHGEKSMLETFYKSEIETTKDKFDEEKTKLIEKIQLLEEEKAEAELKFLNEKAAMEQQFRIDKAELELNSSSSKAEFNKSQRDWANLRNELEKGHKEQIQALENEFKRERSKREDETDNRIWELNQGHAKEVASLKQNYEQSKAELEQKFSRQKAEMRESFTREKNEMMQKFERELAEQREALEKEFCQNLSEQEAELRKGFFKENSDLEKNLREEKYQLEEEYQEKVAASEKSFQKWKSEIEEHFTEEKAKLLQNAAREKSEIENKYKDEISELRQAFSNGEAGLKGQLKEDFYEMLAKHKAELEQSYAKSKAQLEESFFREKADLQRSSLVESSEVRDSYTREKADLEESYKKKIKALQDNFAKEKNEIENERLKEKEELRAELEAEFSFRMKTDHEDLEETVKHLQGEINYLKEQKKELETKVQSLELKTLGRESLDIKVAREKISDLERKLELLTKEKSNLQKENNEYKIKVDEIQKENKELTESALEKQRKLAKMDETKSELVSLERRLDDVNQRKLFLERQMQEKNTESKELYEEVCTLKDKIDKIDSSYRREIDIEKQKVMVATTELETARSKHQRDIAELRDQLHRANIASERDQALREKVFNEAKAEVISLNKKLEEKTRRVRELENASQLWEKRIGDLETQKMEMAIKVQHARDSLDEHVARLSKQLQHSEMRNTRSDTLVQELYIENAKLTKALQQTEANEKKAEKNLRQLMEQKRALQRVISKLCGANAIA